MNDSQTFTFLATAAFGLEGVVATELKQLGMKNVVAGNGGARFTATMAEAYRANLRLRCADRVLIILGEARVETFEELFRFTQTIPWEHLLTRNGKINVSGKCVRSQLMSIRDCQAIVKKAIIERLRVQNHQQNFPETGAAFPIEIAIRDNQARLTLDTTGEALNRRGYRTWNGEAPLRETLAAALVTLSPWRPGMPLYDPCCGTGTLLIEAAWRGMHRAPGLTRRFACEDFPFFPTAEAAAIHAEVEAEVLTDRTFTIGGSDIDPEAIELAQRHICQAELENTVNVHVQALETLQLEGEPGVFLCNPPYGERLGDQKTCRQLYAEMGTLLQRHPGWSLCAITSDPAFERNFGRRADKKRRLYNGRLECEFMIFLPKRS